LDVTRAEREFGFRARTPFDLGLLKTVEWYQTHRLAAASAPQP
jgi:nucleoside-diphosphate-sugar epimerase